MRIDDASEVRIVYMGDSITFGQYVDTRSRWTTIIDARLDAKFRSTAVKFVTYNRGVSGETTRMALERFPRDVQQVRPHIVTLQYGLNDCNCWDTDEGMPRVTSDAFRANLAEMIARARTFGALHVILSTNHRTLRRRVLANGEPYEEANARYNEIVRTVASTAGVRLCDVGAAFVGFSSEHLSMLLLPEPDLLHLSEDGNALYADLIWPHIEEGVSSMLARRRIAISS
jgi:lysophospholipase L1-like esterase